MTPSGSGRYHVDSLQQESAILDTSNLGTYTPSPLAQINYKAALFQSMYTNVSLFNSSIQSLTGFSSPLVHCRTKWSKYSMICMGVDITNSKILPSFPDVYSGLIPIQHI